MKISIEKIIAESNVGFGTSGVRGLVSDMSDVVCFSYVSAFLMRVRNKNYTIGNDFRVGIAGDLRSSTDRIMNACAAACVHQGYQPINLGKIPSPAAALYGITEFIPTIMVTGSHIPDDRNGIKFNAPIGEILKQDEQAIRKLEVTIPEGMFENGSLADCFLPPICNTARSRYVDRYINFFDEKLLKGFHIGVYEHSSVAGEMLREILEHLGADVMSLGKSDVFVPVDTEAIRSEDQNLASYWAKQHKLDSIVSTDGDGDRPLVSDEHGRWLRGDILGILVAKVFAADCVVTPISSNTALEKSGYFKKIVRTRIGSPYVIETMKGLADQYPEMHIVGYEANGGFLLQTDISLNNHNLAALPTRDAIVVILAVLILSKNSEKPVSRLIDDLPKRFTVSDRIKDCPITSSRPWIDRLSQQLRDKDASGFSLLFPNLSAIERVDETDGIRLELCDASVVHFRLSGNAPEFRCYTEADSQEQAEAINHYCLQILAEQLHDTSYKIRDVPVASADGLPSYEKH